MINHKQEDQLDAVLKKITALQESMCHLEALAAETPQEPFAEEKETEAILDSQVSS